MTGVAPAKGGWPRSVSRQKARLETSTPASSPTSSPTATTRPAPSRPTCASAMRHTSMATLISCMGGDGAGLAGVPPALELRHHGPDQFVEAAAHDFTERVAELDRGGLDAERDGVFGERAAQLGQGEHVVHVHLVRRDLGGEVAGD